MEYKDKKREFRKRKRAAERSWQEQKYEDFKSTAEIDIGEFFNTVRKTRKVNSPTIKLSYKEKLETTDDNIC